MITRKFNSRIARCFLLFLILITIRSFANQGENPSSFFEENSSILNVEQSINEQFSPLQFNQQDEAERINKLESTILISALVLTLFLGGFVFERFLVISKQKRIIEEQKRQVEYAISYALRVQSSILPEPEVIKEVLKDSFILYKPRNLVSGDFYWLHQKDNTVFFAAADCTGNGLLGAMMTFVCYRALNTCVNEYGLTDPGEILSKIQVIVGEIIEGEDPEILDTIDIALCSLDGGTLKYAGANNPLWILRNGADEVIEIPPNQFPLGSSKAPVEYKTREVELGIGDSIYIFSDGHIAQLGSNYGENYKCHRLIALLASISKSSMDEQRRSIENSFECWRNELEQFDDVCVIGVRISD